MAAGIRIATLLAGPLLGFEEVASQYSFEAGAPWIATADFGLSRGFNDDTQTDIWCNIGVAEAADNVAFGLLVPRRF